MSKFRRALEFTKENFSFSSLDFFISQKNRKKNTQKNINFEGQLREKAGLEKNEGKAKVKIEKS